MLILASSSPRRRDLLRNAGLEFMVQSADVPEIHEPGERPQAFVERLARAKASATADRLDEKTRAQAWIIGADTVVVVNDEIFGKPKDAADATRMLRRLSDASHEVITGVAVLHGPSGSVESEVTRVEFGPLSEREIADYIATGEPMDKAGAYACQGIASRWVTRVEGDYPSVMGLPVARLWRMLRRAGYQA